MPQKEMYNFLIRLSVARSVRSRTLTSLLPGSANQYKESHVVYNRFLATAGSTSPNMMVITTLILKLAVSAQWPCPPDEIRFCFVVRIVVRIAAEGRL